MMYFGAVEGSWRKAGNPLGIADGCDRYEVENVVASSGWVEDGVSWFVKLSMDVWSVCSRMPVICEKEKP